MKYPGIGKFFEQKFLEWQMSLGGRRTIEEFAQYLGTSQPYLSRIMKGERKPSFKIANQWAPKLGDDLFDVLGYKRPDANLDRLLKKYDEIPPEKREEFVRKFLDHISDVIEEN